MVHPVVKKTKKCLKAHQTFPCFVLGQMTNIDKCVYQYSDIRICSLALRGLLPSVQRESKSKIDTDSITIYIKVCHFSHRVYPRSVWVFQPYFHHRLPTPPPYVSNSFIIYFFNAIHFVNTRFAIDIFDFYYFTGVF